MKDESNSNEEMSEESPIDSKDESVEEAKTEQTKQAEEKPVEAKKETWKKPEKKSKEGKPGKGEQKKEETKKRIDRGPDFKYIVRIANTDINGEKNVVYGLSSIRGIGAHMAHLIVDKAGINGNMKTGDLKDDQIQKLQETIDTITKNAPSWMLNHRKDYETGEDIHLVGTNIDTRLRDEINIMKKIRSYRGVRHEFGLKVRGQRTSSNGRRGLALGVSKRREAPAQAAAPAQAPAKTPAKAPTKAPATPAPAKK